MSITSLLFASLLQAVAPVPGLCTAPAAENIGKPGCYVSADLRIDAAPASIYWHIHTFDTLAEATAEAARHEHAIAVSAHERAFVYVLGAADLVVGGERRDVVGPLDVAAGKPLTARFLESLFPPGMRTRVHAHPGPEAFHVIDGEQCTETPETQHTIAPGTSFIVPGGRPHMQAAPKGRRSVVVLLLPEDAPWMTLDESWTASDYCAG